MLKNRCGHTQTHSNIPKKEDLASGREIKIDERAKDPELQQFKNQGNRIQNSQNRMTIKQEQNKSAAAKLSARIECHDEQKD